MSDYESAETLPLLTEPTAKTVVIGEHHAKPTHEDILQYLAALYHHDDVEGEIVLVRDKSKRVGIFKTNELAKAAEFIEAEPANLFIKYNLIDSKAMRARNEFGIGAKDEVSTIVALGLDVDAGKGEYESQAYAVEKLYEMPLPPSMIVLSNQDGAGLHPYWLVEPHVVPFDVAGKRSHKRYEDMAQGWYDLLVEKMAGNPVDSTHNLDRLLRPVGGLRDSGCFNRFLEFHPERRYTVEQIESLLPVPKARPAPTYNTTSGPIVSTDSNQLVREVLDRAQIQYATSATSATSDGTRYTFPCPWAEGHSTPDSDKDFSVLVRPGGKITVKCFHEGSCSGRTWPELRELFQPGYLAERERKEQEFQARQNRSSVDLSGVMQSSALSDQVLAVEWPEPKALPPALPNVYEFEADILLPDTIRPFVVDIADRMQCPIDFPSVSFVSAFSSLIGRQLGIRPKRQDDWTVVPNLWALAIGRPGLMKSPAVDGPLRIVRRLEIEESKRFTKAMEQYQQLAAIAKARKSVRDSELKKAIKKGASDEEIISGFDEAEVEQPKRRRYIVNDVTVERLGEILQESPNGVLLERDEIYSFLKTMDKQGHEADRGFYLTSWDGDKRYVYDRVMRGETVISGACVSLVGTIQPGRLQSYVRGAMEGGASDDGLLQRFQLAVWPECPRQWVNVDRWPDKESANVVSDIAEQLRDLKWDGARSDDFGGIPYVRFTPDAQIIFDEYRAELEHRLRDDSLSPCFESHLAKYRSLIPSLALIFHVVDSTGGDVSKESLIRAIHWGRYLESHAKRIYSAGSGAAAVHEMAKKLKANKLGSGFTMRDVERKNWAGLSDKQAVSDVLGDLAELDWLRAKMPKQATGRPTVRYAINPRIFGDTP